MQDRASRPNSLKEATSSEVVLHNEIEAEVIAGAWRCASVESMDDGDESPAFGRHMFENKKAHRVACLLASARLIASLSGQA
eukprot:3434886-Rhodomonas_salina.1